MPKPVATEKHAKPSDWMDPAALEEERAIHFSAMLDPDNPPSPESILEALDAGWRMEDDPAGKSAAALYVDTEVLRAFVEIHGRRWQHAMADALRKEIQAKRSA